MNLFINFYFILFSHSH
uniref:Uncharacterized protein n=1 Tax=Anguilla anguilla TaxID=7936 RepID=A0A0E9UIP8_ANGAN